MNAIATSGRIFWAAVLALTDFLKVITGWKAREVAREQKLILGRRDIPATAVNALREPCKIDVFHVADSQGVALGVLKFWSAIEEVGQGGAMRSIYVTRREFSVCHTPLAEAMGVRRMPLAAVQSFPGADVNILRERTLREIEDKLKRELQFGPDDKPVPAAPVRPRIEPVAQLPVVAQPAQAVPVQPPSVQPQPQPRERELREPAAQQSMQAAQQRHARPLQREYVGIVQTFGLVPRRVTEHGVPRSFEHFGVNLKLTSGENAGSATYVWGAELEQLLSDAEVQQGDHVRITHVGREQLAGKEGRYKNLFAIKKL